MKAEKIIDLRDKISALLLSEIDGHYDAEKACVAMAARQLDQFGSMGGSTRAKAEAEIVRLVKEFDTTRNDTLGQWPVSKFMIETEGKAATAVAALKAVIRAHKTGRYEPLSAAVEAAENMLSDME